MKSQFNEYYQCSSAGYIKHENVPASHLPMIRELPVASRCNQILPYKLHKIQVKQPLVLSPARQVIAESVSIPGEVPSKDAKKDTYLNYSFSASLMQDPSKILQKDEVHSIHLDEKSTSARIKTIPNSVDLTKSTYTTTRKHSPDMKRSLFSTNNSVLTHYTVSKQKQNQKIEMIAGELKKQIEKREEFEKKYDILLNLVNRAEEAKETATDQEPSQNSQKTFQNPESKSKKTKLKTQKKKIYQNSNTENSEESQEQRPIFIASKKGRRKSSSPSPIIIHLDSQILQKSPNQRKRSTIASSQHKQEQMSEIKQGIQQIKRQVEILHENMEYLEKKLDQQEMRHQKEMLMQELKEKERKIEEVIKENQKIKEINELLVNKKVQPINDKQGSLFGVNLSNNSMGAGFVISLLLILLILNLRNAIC